MVLKEKRKDILFTKLYSKGFSRKDMAELLNESRYQIDRRVEDHTEQLYPDPEFGFLQDRKLIAAIRNAGYETVEDLRISATLRQCIKGLTTRQLKQINEVMNHAGIPQPDFVESVEEMEGSLHVSVVRELSLFNRKMGVDVGDIEISMNDSYPRYCTGVTIKLIRMPDDA